MPGLDEAPPVLKRNTLASLYFERERRNHDPWLTPRSANDTVGSILARHWEQGLPESAPQPGSVPIAALLRVDCEWVLDTWIARRDIGGPPAREAWEGHLGLGSWNIFLAQVLQFQAQLADGDEQLWRMGSQPTNYESTILARISEAVSGLPTPSSKKGRENHQAALAAVSDLEEAYTAKTPLGTATQFGELPPAGILPWPQDATADKAAEYFRNRFGPHVVVEVEATRADCALRALEDGQHLDRIPLNAAEPYPVVRLLVPSEPADLSSLVPRDGYSWMVFTRGCSRARCDEVDVYVFEFALEDPADAFTEFTKAPPEPLTTLSYPHDTWAIPGGTGAVQEIREKLPSGEDKGESIVIGVAASNDRQSVALARAGLLNVDLRPHKEPEQPSGDVYVVTYSDLGREAILIVIPPPPAPIP
jgi:hypothetical protein